MRTKSHITSRSRGLFVAFLFLGSLGLSGCHDWPDERATAIEAQNILRDLGQIETVADANVQGPAIYKSPPKKLKQIVGGGEEWKLIYFCRYHTAEEMKQIINEQFATKLFDEKGKSNSVTDYTVTANPATNQLIARCPTEMDADAIIEIIKETDIPPIQVRIDCMVSELYADLTVDRETRMLIDNIFGEGVKLSGQQDNGNLAFPGAELRDPARAKFGLKIGISQNNLNALVDILVSRGYMKILMHPSLEVVNGQTAKIQSKQHQPLQQITYTSAGAGGGFILGTQTEYYDIIDSLQITPHVYADGYIGLETQAQIAAYLTPEGIKQTPNVTERMITNKDNRIRLGESLVIGGIRKSEKRDVIRGVPILKDIPLLSILFSGRDFEERATEVIFILTPTISSGGKPNEEMVQFLRERHSSPMTQSFQEKVMDPLGLKAREQEQQRQLDNAREARHAYESQATISRLEAMESGQQIEDLQVELEQAKVKVDQIGTKADAAASKAEEAKTEAEKAATEAKQAKEQATQKSPADAPKVVAVENKKADPPKNEPPAPPKSEAPKEQPRQPKPDAPKEQASQPKADAPKEPPAPPKPDAAKAQSAQAKPDAPKEQTPPQQQNNQQPKPAEQRAQESEAGTSKAEQMQD
jgi:Flp pilus assembly secretin CpaC